MVIETENMIKLKNLYEVYKQALSDFNNTQQKYLNEQIIALNAKFSECFPELASRGITYENVDVLDNVNDIDDETKSAILSWEDSEDSIKLQNKILEKYRNIINVTGKRLEATEDDILDFYLYRISESIRASNESTSSLRKGNWCDKSERRMIIDSLGKLVRNLDRDNVVNYSIG